MSRGNVKRREEKDGISLVSNRENVVLLGRFAFLP